MGHLVSAFLLGVSSNIDNLGVGIAYGVRRRSIDFGANLLIALVSGAATLLSMAAGEWLNDFMSESFANLLGGAIMIGIGLYGVARAAHRSDSAPPQIASGPHTSASEAVLLAISLASNNLGGGLAAGISHVGIAATTALTIVGSMVAIAGGVLLGRRTSRVVAMSARRLGVSAGLIFIAVGIYELFV